MTTYVLCSVFDKAAQSYGRVFQVPAAAIALRSFEQEVNRDSPDNMMFHNPQDFALYVVSEFNDYTGTCTELARPELIVEASTLRRSQNG